MKATDKLHKRKKNTRLNLCQSVTLFTLHFLKGTFSRKKVNVTTTRLLSSSSLSSSVKYLFAWLAVYLISISVAEAGDDLMTVVGDRVIMMGNHQSTADVPTLFYALQPKGSVINNLMWIQDVLFKLTDFGWVSIVHGDFFIQQAIYTKMVMISENISTSRILFFCSFKNNQLN